MPGAMDERVVSMEFDNKQFERNVKTSMKTIDDLKESLDFDETGESFDEFTSKCKKFGKDNVFKDVDSSVLSLRKGIGLLGDSAGSLISQFAEVTKITAMFELAEQAVRKLESAIKSLTIQPISAGFEKYTTKIGSIKTIANATGMAADDVNKSLDRLNWFTDETSASFSEMVNNIGKFTSVGKGLEESITAMEGIATWGYHSGANVGEINRAMYNLSQALGTGSVKLIDWKSIENAGMATKEFKEQAIAAAEAAGTLVREGDKLFAKGEGKNAKKIEVTSANFNETLQKGWFTSDVLMSTLKEYGDFADKVKRYQEEHALDTAKDAMDAMDEEREAKRDKIYDEYLDTWAKSAKKSSSMVKNEIEKINKIASVKQREEEIKKFAKTINMSYEETKKVLDNLAETEESLGEKAFKSSQQSKSFTDSLEATKDAVSTGWMNTFQYIFGGLDKSIELWSDVTDILWDLFAAGSSFRNNAFMHWAEEFNGWADLWNADPDKGPLGALRNLANIVIELKETLGSSFKDVFFPALAKIAGQETITQDDAKDMAKHGLRTVEQIRKWREGNYMGYQLKQVTKGIREFTAKINEFFTNEKNIEKFRQIFTSIATVVQFTFGVIKEVFSAVTNFVKKTGIFQDILNILTGIANKVTEVFNKFQQSGFIKKLFGKISDTFAWFYNTIKRWVGEITAFWEESGIGPAVRGFFTRIYEYFAGSAEDKKNGVESAFFRSFGWVKKIKDWFDNINLKDILNTVKDFITNFGNLWSIFTASASGKDTKNLRKNLPKSMSGVADALENVGGKLSGVITFFKTTWEKFTGWLETSGILPTLRSWWDGITTFFSNIGLIWEVITKGKVADPKALDEKQKGLVGGILKFLKKIQNAWNKVKGWFSTAWAWISEKWDMFVGWLESSGILPKIRKFADTVRTIFENIGTVWEVFSGILSGKSPMEVLGKYFRKGSTDGATEMTPLQKVLLKVVEIAQKLRGALDTLKNVWNTVWAWIQETWGKFTGWLESSGILPKIREWWGKISTWFTSTIESIKKNGFIETLKSWWEKIKGWFDEVWQNVSSGGVFKSVSDFFTNLWEKITGLFGGGGTVELPTPGTPTVEGGEKKGGIFSGMIENVRNAFITDGKLDLGKGFSTSISKGIGWIVNTISSIDWKNIASMVGGVFVDSVNGINEAFGRLEINNIVSVIQKIAGAFGLISFAKAVTNITSTVKTIAKKGKDKSAFEQFTDLMKAIGQALLEIGIAVGLIAGSIWLLSTINPDRMAAAVGIVAAIAIFMGLIIAAAVIMAKDEKYAKRISTTLAAMGSAFLQIGVAVALITLSIVALTLLFSIGNPGAIAGAVGLVAVIMLGMVGIIALMAKITKGNMVRISAGIAVFAGMAILLGAITICLVILQGLNWGKALIDLLLLAAAMAGMVFAIKAMDKIKIHAKTVTTMILMGVILALITAAFFLLKDADPLAMIAIGVGMGILMLALVTAMQGMEKLGPGAIKGAAIFAAALVIIVGALGVVAGIVSIAAERVTNAIVTVMSNLNAAGIAANQIDYNAITNALGLIDDIAIAMGKLMAPDTTKALAISRAAWDVFTDLKLSGIAASEIDEKQFYKIFGKDGQSGLLQIIQTALSSVTETGWQANRLGKNVETLAENMKLVGQAGVDLTKNIDGKGETLSSGIQTVKDKLENIKEIVQMATDMSTIGTDGKVDSEFLTKFSVGIGNIGAALKLYNEALATFEKDKANNGEAIEASDIAPVDSEAISKALQSVMAVLGTATFDDKQISEIEKWGGLDSATDGGTLFALGLTNIATAMTSFAQSATDFNSGDVDKAITSLDKLADIKGKFTDNSPSDYKGMMDDVGQWGDGGDFKTAISGMGTAIAAFGNSVKDIPDNSVQAATDALDTLAVIYDKLKTHGTVEGYIAKIGALTIGGTETTTESVQETFTGFAEGISKLSDGLVAFSSALTKKELGYDQKKVDAAVEILKSMSQLEIDLKTVKVNGNWWHDLLFGENGIKKLGESVAGLGTRLTTFSTELSGFDMDINSDAWKNVSGVLSYLAGIWEQIHGLTHTYLKYNENGMVSEQSENMGYTLEQFGSGIIKIKEAMVNVNQMMNSIDNSSGKPVAFGDWSATNLENVKSIITFFKDISIELKNAGLEQGKFYDLDKFGLSIQQFFDHLNSNGSNMTAFMSKVAVPGEYESTTKNFVSFMESIKSMAEATGILHDKNVNAEDVQHICEMIKSAMGDTMGLSGMELATSLLTGFNTRLEQVDWTEGDVTMDGAFLSLLGVIAEYEDDFYNAGKTAGEQYVSGFKEGISTLAPIMSMDNEGNTTTQGSGNTMTLSQILTSMNYATATNIGEVVSCLNAINDRFNNAIKVHDDNVKNVETAVNSVKTNLEETNKKIDALGDKMNKLKVVMDTGALVAEIKDPLNVALASE